MSDKTIGEKTADNSKISEEELGLTPEERKRIKAVADRKRSKPPKYQKIEGRAGIELAEDTNPALFDIALAESTGIVDEEAQVEMINKTILTCRNWGKNPVESANYCLALLHDINPKNAIEGMLATQIVGVHNLSMEMMKRATLPEQTMDGITLNVNRATKLLRTFTVQVDALQKLRGKGQQTVRVEHVTVNAGGQAIVGNVEHKGGGGKDEK